MATLRAIKNRIRSVTNIRQITKAMETVSATKLRRAQARAEQGAPYADKMGDILNNLVGSLPADAKIEHPLMEVRPVHKICLVVVASDKGLCGSFNTNVVRAAKIDAATWASQGVEVVILPIGKKSRDAFKRDPQMVEGYVGLDQSLPFGELKKVTDHLVSMFTSGEVDRVDFVFTRFRSASVQRVSIEQFLPLSKVEAPDAGAAKPKERDYIFEPHPQELFVSLLPAYARVKVFFILAQNAASEHAARMVSMKNATDNASELIKSLTLSRNKARQAAITKELSEIVGGAEALKG